ncbi:presenilins-associated rhomboid-like protein, mitochondrial isoform X1 [Haliotis rubra]|uniref:presenilins-associated rhomboid-like protein, mitochondrial isoform X1 n=2 Tax=Haliotis rubra TaxID=36100 RepID=UPI001EE602C4|nr:presenilins-associated rhomboid-like protein, mitochondrial isoform X1 [Haliotis rubra]
MTLVKTLSLCSRVVSTLQSCSQPRIRLHHFLCVQTRRGRPQQLPWLHRCFRTRRKTDKETVAATTSATGSLLKPLCFSVVVCGASFTGAMVWQYETLRYYARRLHNDGNRKNLDAALAKSFGFRAHLNSIWTNFSPGQKVVLGVVASNIGVFLLWRIPSLTPILMKYFSSAPGRPLPSMILSAFSHFSFLHLAANMYVLWSFSSISLDLFGKEQLSAVYLSAAAVSSFASTVHKVLRGRPVPSLGASGALMAVLGAVCISYPDARLSIAFLGEIVPHSFSASNALTGVIVLDVVGLLLGWRMFDHAAHLGGMLFGLWYTNYGREVVWRRRQAVMKFWHDMRGKP